MNKYTDSFIEGTAPIQASAKNRYGIPSLALFLAVTLLGGRSFYLQVVHGASFRDRAEHNRIQQITVEAPRGIFYDRNGVALVSNIPATNLVLDPVLLPQQEEESTLIDNLLALMPELTPGQVRDALMQARSQGREVILAKTLPHETVLKLQEESERIPGTRLASTLVREYQSAHSLAHILGYTGPVTESDLTQNESLLLQDQIGKSGLEKQYDASIRGTHGISYQEVNASGRTQTNLGTTPPTPGEDISLTLDSELQNFIYGLYSERDQKMEDEETKGAAIVLNPQNGEILAAVSYPSFDANAFSKGETNRSATFISDNKLPLFNRFADGTYPSGSTIKPFLAAAALEEGIITAGTTMSSTGGIEIGQWYFPDWKAGGHGPTNVTKAIAESVNTFFYAISGGWEEQQGIGVEKGKQYLEQFGWGSPTEVDLPSEAAGFLPDPAWKERVKGERWYVGDTYHFGIGQGDVLVTPLQVATSTAAIANGRYLYSPRFVAGETKREEVPVSQASADVVRQGMRQAVTEGSAKSLQSLPLSIAGKTGTAQVGGSESTHAWFTSFAPYEQPEYVVTVLLEKGGAGDVDAVPVAKEIWQWLIENRSGQ